MSAWRVDAEAEGSPVSFTASAIAERISSRGSIASSTRFEGFLMSATPITIG